MRSVLQLASVSFLSSFTLNGCYTLTQGFEQAKLITRRVPIDDVLKDGREIPERLEKLKLVPRVLNYAQEQVGLTPGSSYTTYIALDRPALSYVVQAADKRALKLKTWWFPVVGDQPYLGFFDKQKAQAFQQKLVGEGFDTSMGGVQAFSLLGYFPDPVYSSMIDGNDALDFIELLFHETLHRTIYVPNAYMFNENLAEFVAHKATLMFLNDNPALLSQTHGDLQSFAAKHEKTQQARKAFGEFLNIAKDELNRFYSDPAVIALELKAFLQAREEKFAALNERYLKEFGARVSGTHYSRFFEPKRFNNATLLGASVYEARQEPLARQLENNKGDLAKFIRAIKTCVERVKGSESDVWAAVETCGG